MSASAERLLRALAPPLIGGLLVLLLFQVPLAWSMARRLQRGHREREVLLTNAIEASSQERRRIAADLHDGVVQDLAGVAFGLAPLADDARSAAATSTRRGACATRSPRLRQGVRDLRTLLVEIHPPRLETAGLEVALERPAQPAARRTGIETELHVDDGAAPGRAATRSSTASRARRCATSPSTPRRDSVRVDVTRPGRRRRAWSSPTTAAASTPASARAAARRATSA